MFDLVVKNAERCEVAGKLVLNDFDSAMPSHFFCTKPPGGAHQ